MDTSRNARGFLCLYSLVTPIYAAFRGGRRGLRALRDCHLTHKSATSAKICVKRAVTLPIGLQNWNHRFAVNLSYKVYFILYMTELAFCHSALGLSTLTIGSIVLQNGIRCNVLETQG